jgi:hypothetical protein
LLILSSNNWPDAYEVRPRKDRRGVDLISDALPFGRLINDPAELLADPREDLEPGADPSQLFAKVPAKCTICLEPSDLADKESPMIFTTVSHAAVLT